MFQSTSVHACHQHQSTLAIWNSTLCSYPLPHNKLLTLKLPVVINGALVTMHRSRSDCTKHEFRSMIYTACFAKPLHTKGEQENCNYLDLILERNCPLSLFFVLINPFPNNDTF